MNQSTKTKAYWALFIGGLFLVEAALSAWTGLKYDMTVWFQTGVWMEQGINIYLPNDHLGYPPLWAFWCLAAKQVFNLSGGNMELWRFVVKLPLILAQFALAFAMWKFTQTRFDNLKAKKILIIALTWVFFIYIGALWGQLNMLSALLTFLAFYAVTGNRNTLGAILLGLAVILKIYPLIVLPAFLVYIIKNGGKKASVKFTVITCALPVIFTVAVFSVYQWGLEYFMRTIFYWAPVYETNPLQIQGGCMNIWSFTGLLRVDISEIWLLRFSWIPVLAANALYWYRKPSMKMADLNLAIISFYIWFLISYGWVTEQSFLDPLPFIFLQIVLFNPKKAYWYALLTIQALIFGFSTFNHSPFIFEPLLLQFSPQLLHLIQVLDPQYPLIWTIRGVLGLTVSLALCLFLVALAKPTVFSKIAETIKNSKVHHYSAS
ncbi:MAG: glycosyltransferase 87 family protein [Methanocella sp.]